MFYETAQTIGPGWHRSYKPTHYEDMNWSPSSKNMHSPGESPQSYRKIIHPEDYSGDDKATSTNDDEDEFFGRHSPTFRRKIFKDVWEEPSSSNHRFQHFADRPRMFKKVFKPSRLDKEFEDFDRGSSTARQMEKEFSSKFGDIPRSRFDSDFDSRKRNFDEEFEKAAGRVHHIPIMVERRMDEMKSRFNKSSPASEKPNYEENESEEWSGPQVHRLRKNFEPNDDYSMFHDRHRVPRVDISNSRPRAFTSPIPATWEPGCAQTLPTRKSSKTPQVHEEKRSVTPKPVFRSYSETQENSPRSQQQTQQHTAAFRSHSDGHCPKNTYVTKISVNVPSSEDNQYATANGNITEEYPAHRSEDDGWDSHQSRQKCFRSPQESEKNTPQEYKQTYVQNDTDEPANDKIPKEDRNNPAFQQINAVLQNVDDLLVHVDGYNGMGRDKQFRFLDEMLTRCMIRLDDVDTEGREDIRNARKAAVRQVQSCIEKLESKADESEKRKREKESKVSELSSSNEDRVEEMIEKSKNDQENKVEEMQKLEKQEQIAKDSEEEKSAPSTENDRSEPQCNQEESDTVASDPEQTKL